MTIENCGQRLRDVVIGATPRLRAMTGPETNRVPAPGKWSPKQILGHLIDSASNNHQRFVRAQLQDGLVFDGYDQEAWVTSQGYQEASWSQLIDLWASFNLHLARVMERIPASRRHESVTRHNLDRIAWRTPRPGGPVTLDFFMCDYVDHLEHHLDQIFDAVSS